MNTIIFKFEIYECLNGKRNMRGTIQFAGEFAPNHEQIINRAISTFDMSDGYYEYRLLETEDAICIPKAEYNSLVHGYSAIAPQPVRMKHDIHVGMKYGIVKTKHVTQEYYEALSKLEGVLLVPTDKLAWGIEYGVTLEDHTTVMVPGELLEFA